MSDDFTDAPDTYWEQDAINDRDEWEQHLRAVEEAERERVADHDD